MKQLVVISGKGGTGKTSLVASLFQLATAGGAPVVAADCDVDAANLGLLLFGPDRREEPFSAGRRARIDPDLCIGCGDCLATCRFGALRLSGTTAVVDTMACEGCGVCGLVCPADSVSYTDNVAGVWRIRDLPGGSLIHARLGIAQDNSGKLVARVRELAREEAVALGADRIIVDGPPGIGCPVHAALTGCDLALVVTEPTPSGEHDLRRVLELTEHFRVPTAVLLNKAGLAPAVAARIADLARVAGAPLVGQLPFDPGVPRALSRGELPLVIPAVATPIRQAWEKVSELLDDAPAQG